MHLDKDSSWCEKCSIFWESNLKRTNDKWGISQHRWCAWNYDKTWQSRKHRPWEGGFKIKTILIVYQSVGEIYLAKCVPVRFERFFSNKLLQNLNVCSNDGDLKNPLKKAAVLKALNSVDKTKEIRFNRLKSVTIDSIHWSWNILSTTVN